MYTQEQAAPRGGAAAIAIVIHGVLIYGLAIGLGAVPRPSLPNPFEVVMVPNDPTPVPMTPENPTSQPNFTSEPHLFAPPTMDPFVIEPPTVLPPRDPTGDGSVGSVGPREVELAFSQAQILRSYEPPYPDVSRRRGEEGTVYVRITLTADGRITTVQLDRSSGMARLDEAALSAVRAWRFTPATRGGQGVSTSVVVPVKFQLRS